MKETGSESEGCQVNSIFLWKIIKLNSGFLFIGIEIIKNGTELETRVYRKATNTNLLLHFQSYVVKRYKTGLLKTMLHRAYALSSTKEAFNEECAKLRSIFSRLDNPIGLINSTINTFIQNIAAQPEKNTDGGNTIRIVFPFKDQIAANAVRRQLRDLSNKIAFTLQPIFVSKKLEQDIKPKEIKPSIVSRQCVVYKFAWICVMQIMLVIQPDTFINALPNTSIRRLSVNTFQKCTVTKIFLLRTNFVFSRSAAGNLTASFTKCFSSKN